MEKSVVIFAILLIMFTLQSINANGLREVNKFKSLCGWLIDQRCDFCLIQETFWSDDFVSEIEHLWDGGIFYNNAHNNRAGVAVLVNNKWKSKVKVLHKDNEGRTIIVQINDDENIITLVSIYAPSSVNDRVVYFEYLLQHMPRENIVIGGDFNTSFSQQDRCNTIHNYDKAYYKLNSFMNDTNLYDVWRQRNPHTNVYSWKRVIEGVLKMSRIDFYIVSKSLGNFIKNVYYRHTTISDHNFICMKIDFSCIEKGPGVWIFNNQFLKDTIFKQEIKQIIEREKKCSLYNTEFTVWWDNLKYKIRKKCQLYGQERNKSKYTEYNTIQRQISKFNDNVKSQNVDIMKYESLKEKLNVLEMELCQGAILRSKAKWAIEGDKNTKYFLNLEKYRQVNNSVSELITDDGTELKETSSILDEEYTYYKNLYSCVNTDDKDIENFIGNLTNTISEEEKLLCDGDIQIQEITDALCNMSKNKSPGSDGLTVEFYIELWDIFSTLFSKLFKCIERDGIMSRTMRYGHITLLYKKGDRKRLKNWRPISLLNVDYKILSRVMSNRFKNVLTSIISIEQSSSVPGRDISDTVASIRDIIDMVENENSEGYLVKIDQEKAFDRVSHKYLFKLLDKFGFGRRFCRWITIFYNQIHSAVKCNGFLTKYFPVKNSVRQGCPISAMLFVLTAEPLNQAIKNCNRIKGIPIPGSDTTSLIFQHADDTTVTVSDKESITNVFKVFEHYGRASGAKVNKLKSEVMCLGKSTLEREYIERLEFKICSDVVEILGIFVGKNKKEAEEKNWRNKVGKINNLLNMWKQRHLNIQGRAIVISSLLVSRIWYACFVIEVPTWVLDELKTQCLRFLWMKKSYPVKYTTIISDKKIGGLNFPDITTKIKAFRMKSIGKFLNRECKALWKHTFLYFLNNTLKLNLDREYAFIKFPEKLIKQIPGVYREMLIVWNDIRQKSELFYDNESIFRQPIFWNPKITFKDKVICFNFFIKAGITQIKDLTYEVIPGLLPLNAVKELILEQCSDISEIAIEKAYSVICSCLPLEWFRIINTYTAGTLCSKTFYPEFVLLYDAKPIPLCQCSTSIFYKILRDDIIDEPLSCHLWRNFSSDFDIQTYGRIIHLNNKCPDMIDLDFRIFHNIIYTNVKLNKMRIVDSALCTMCKTEPEDLFHMYIRCPRIAKFRKFISDRVEIICKGLDNAYMNRLNFDLMLLLGLPGKHTNLNHYFLNFFLSHARMCIHKTRLVFISRDKTIDIISFFKYSLEKHIEYIFSYHTGEKKNNFNKHFLYQNDLMKVMDDRPVLQW